MFSSKRATALIAAGLSSALFSTQALADDIIKDGPKLAVAASGGTLGVGLEGQYRLSGTYAARGGLYGLQFTLDDEVVGPVAYQQDIELANALFGMEWHPRGDGWLISGGVVAGKKERDYRFALSGNIEIGDIIVTPEEVGSVRGQGAYEDISPYLAVGYDTAVFGRQNPWGLSILAGIEFTGKPDVTVVALDGLLVGTPGLNEALAIEAAEIRDAQNDYFPILQVGLSYSFR